MTKGRRPGKPDTKAEILQAAKAEFAGAGYDAATIRSIAARASVDPALVMHYFGSKDQLFAACLELPINPATMMRRVVEDADGSVGEELIRTVLSVWDSDTGKDPFVAALRSATAVGPVHDTVREFIRGSILVALTDAVDGEHAELRASLAASQLVGLLVGRYVLRIQPLVDAHPDDIVAAVGPTLDRYLMG